MHLNYYFLRFLSAELRERIIGYTFSECYLQSRNECIIGLYKGNEEFFIKLNLYQEFTSLSFPEEFSKSKKGTYNLFKELNGLKVLDIIQHTNDRSFHILFENEYSLMFKLYGSRSNLILFHQNNSLEIANKNLIHDKEIELAKVHKIIKQDFENFVNEKENLKKIFPAFDNEIIHELDLANYSQKDSKEKWQLIQQLLNKLEEKKFIIEERDAEIVLSFFAHGKELLSTDSPIEAANYYDRCYGQIFYFNKEKQETLNYLVQKEKKVNAYLTIIENKLKELQEQTPYDHIANILMANLHQIPKNVDSVELLNFYTEQPIRIKIKKDLTPQKNAENYYRKHKNQKKEITELEKTIENKKTEAEQLERQIDFVKDCENLKSLRRYKKEQHIQEDKVVKEKEQESLFRHFEIEGFEILIGKSAKNNDLLTQKYSYKEDLWLHARDVAGSHVLIKYKAGKSFPKTVIEGAAQLAAYYSRRKTDSLCPVIVTPKKFVRKPKGALDGQVLVEREEVILVKPAGYDELK